MQQEEWKGTSCLRWKGVRRSAHSQAKNERCDRRHLEEKHLHLHVLLACVISGGEKNR